MSIFQSKEFWSAKIGDNEEFDPHHLCIANIDNEEPETQKIVIGSFTGFLRIYLPTRNPFKAEDLLYEMNLGQAIVQIEAGHFVPNARELILCVLFFKKISFYAFISGDRQGMQAKLICENKLARNACNMTIGGFGGARNKDLICIQSIDGMLMIYEQDKLVCMCQINDFVLPGPIAYHPIIDSFIIQNSNLEIECYEYSQIGAVFNNTSKDNKVLRPAWSFNVGETATDIVCVMRNERVFDLVVLAEQMMFVLTNKGTVKAQKKLDYIPSCICVYNNSAARAVGSGEEAMRPLYFLIGSTSHHLMVYQDFQLIWTAKTNFIAHALKVATFSLTKGLVVTLNDEGWLEVSYLGTSPPQVNLTTEEKKEINYVKAQEEYISILKQIDQRESSQAPEITEQLRVHSQCMGVFAQTGYFENADQYFRDSNGSVIYAKYRISLSFTGNRAQNVVMNLNLPHNIWAPQTTYMIEDLRGQATPYNLELQLYALTEGFPYKHKFEVHINYFNSSGGKGFLKDPRTAYHECEIPILLQTRIVPPIKQANFKITVQSSSEMPPLDGVFADFLKHDQEAAQNLNNPNVASFELSNGIDCTILVAKTGNKFRVQSSQFEGLFFVTEMLVKQVQSRNPKMSFTFPDSLPLQDFFMAIDEHYNNRNSVKEKRQSLEQKANEFRVIEKRMLTRFKDRNPTPMNNLDFLMQKCYQDIMELGNIIEEEQAKLQACSHKLHVSAQFISFLLKLRFSLPDSFDDEIRSYIADDVLGTDAEIGWEEITYNNLSYLAKFIASKGEMGDYKSPALQRLDDVGKLKKTITSFLDKIAKYGANMPLPSKFVPKGQGR